MLFKCHRSINNSNDFDFVVKRITIKKNSVVNVKNPVVNYQSRPVKWNPPLVATFSGTRAQSSRKH